MIKKTLLSRETWEEKKLDILKLWIFVSEKLIILLYEHRGICNLWFEILLFDILSFGICDWSLTRWKTSSPRFKIQIIYQHQYQILFSNPREKLTIINFKIKSANEFNNNKLKVVIKKFNISNNLKLFFNPRDWRDSKLASRRGNCLCDLSFVIEFVMISRNRRKGIQGSYKNLWYFKYSSNMHFCYI